MNNPSNKLLENISVRYFSFKSKLNFNYKQKKPCIYFSPKVSYGQFYPQYSTFPQFKNAVYYILHYLFYQVTNIKH